MLSEAPNPNPAKTKSARKTKYLIVAAAIVALIVAGFFGAARVLQGGQGSSAAVNTRKLTVNQGTDAQMTYSLEVADTPEAQQQGLSGRESLPNDRGMLFEYSGGMHDRCIWMKDMKFSIDVLWLNADKRVVSAVSGMKPESYPQNYCVPAESVIELPAGAIKEQGIRPGQILPLL